MRGPGATTPTGPAAIGSPKTMMPPAMPAMFAAVPVTAITGTASPSCSARAEAKKATIEAAIATISQGLVARPMTPWAPVMPVRALIEVSETPNSSPAAAASMTPWCSTGPPMRGPMIRRPPIPNRPASKAIMTAGEKCACAPCMAGRVTPSRTRPTAVRISPTHCLGPTVKPNMRSAITAMNTTPAARETWITDIGASARAATCSPQLAVAMIMPSRNHLEEYRSRVERSGCMTRTLGTSWAPLNL